MKSADRKSLKVHVADNKVWYIRGLGTPEPSYMPEEEFMEGPIAREYEHFRLVGSHSNAALITKLYHLKQKDLLSNVEVVTPLVCVTEAERRNPEAVLARMRLCAQAPSQGGFHELTENDYRAYALSVEVMKATKNGAATSKQALRLLNSHPAWKALSFIKSLDPAHVAGLLSYIRDPRWFIDPCYPDRLGKLEASLGLNPKTQAGVAGVAAKWRHHQRCALVLRCWKNDSKIPDVTTKFELATPIPVPNCDEIGVAPHDFPWRVWGSRMGIGLPNVEPNPVLADLRASQRFLAFVRHTWLSELYLDSQAMPEQQAPLFRARDFFHHETEIAAYEEHCLMRD